MNLTPNQQKFLDGLLAGMRQSDAYRQAYDCTNMNAATVYVEASRLRKHPKIAPIIKEAQANQFKYTLEQHLADLLELREASIEAGQMGPAVQATEKAGRVSGFYVEQSRDLTETDDKTLLQAIEALFGSDLATEAARRLGYDIETTEQ